MRAPDLSRGMVKKHVQFKVENVSLAPGPERVLCAGRAKTFESGHYLSVINKGSRSEALYQRALRVVAGGVSRNTVLRRPHPLYAVSGSGCYVTDIEGKRRLDFANNMTSLIHGHAFPPIVEAVTRQLQYGTAFSMATEAEIKLAEHLTTRTKGFDKVRFVNSGTEAVMSAIKAARAFTGRPKIAKAEGTYHGLYDYAEVSQNPQPANWGPAERPNSVPVAHGTPRSALSEVIVIPINDPATAVKLLDEQKNDIACVLFDPLPHRVGFIPATAEFVRALREWTTRNKALLICDEVITYRSAYSGAQAWFDVTPDLTSLGKMIGGGFPVGALAGREDVMAVFDPLAEKVLFPHGGTFSANPMTMTAGLVAMEHFNRAQVDRLNQLGDAARIQISNAIKETGIPACVTGAGSIFRIHFKPTAPRNYREGYVTPAENKLMKALCDHALDEGVLLIGTGSGTLSTAMTENEIEQLASVMCSGFNNIKGMTVELYQAEKPAAV
jgi:glutamate-1-semialdehyde 2,1-aminomutase